MSQRPDKVQDLLDAAATAFAARARHPGSQSSIAACFEALSDVGTPTSNPGQRLPACQFLPETSTPGRFTDPALRRLAEAFCALEPSLTWATRGGPAPSASPGFAEGHANAMILGPGGFERRSDVWLGVSLLAPGIRYPDHSHPPEETYLVMSAGEFRQAEDPWFTPGIGGSFYNPPGILHAMRAGTQPLFAFWLLRSAA